jgi:hypothetical protein
MDKHGSGIIVKHISGASEILEAFNLPYVPMVHCFLSYKNYRVDLTEGNNNGQNRPLDRFLYTQRTIPNISAKDGYLLYRQALKDIMLARERGIALLKSKINL